MPLKAYEDIGAFKLFIADVGLLSAMAQLNAKTLIEGDKIFKEFKGALTEQYVAQQLKTLNGITVHYWTSERITSEVDFVVQIDNEIIPVEVKSAANLQAKSLKVYRDKYEPNILICTSNLLIIKNRMAYLIFPYIC